MGTQPAEDKKPASIHYKPRRISVETGTTPAQPEMYIHFALPGTADNTISLCCLNRQSFQDGPKYCGLLKLFCLFFKKKKILESHLPMEKVMVFNFLFSFFVPSLFST